MSGVDAMSLVAPEVFTGSAPAGLDFVADEEDLPALEDLAHLPEESIGRDCESADALDGFRDQTGDAAGRGHVDDLLEIAATCRGVGIVVEITERTAEAVAALHEVDVES